MKENLRRLQLIFRLTRLKPEMFYIVTVYSSHIELQGNKSDIGDVNLELKFELDEDASTRKILTFKRNNIDIVKT